MSEESHPKTLYVGNLDHSVQEDLLCTLFSQIGPVKGCKIIREPGNDPYAFVEFTNHQSASTALIAMNKRSFLEKEMKVNWATSPGGNQPKTDTSNHHHIFVGDLSAEIETDTLREAFAPFGEISNCRIVRDPQTLKSKGYAFVSFVKKAEAETAIQAMNGQWLGSRSIRTNWSTRKPPPPRGVNNPSSGGGTDKSHLTKQITFDEVYNQSSPTNTTVYFGGIGGGGTLTEDLVHDTFALYGPIQDIRVFKDKGYAFIKFLTKESATRAIECIHNRQIAGQIVKCFWGKEQPTTIQQQQQQQQQAQQVQQQQTAQAQQQQQQQQQQSQTQDAVTAYAAAAYGGYAAQYWYAAHQQPSAQQAAIAAAAAAQQNGGGAAAAGYYNVPPGYAAAAAAAAAATYGGGQYPYMVQTATPSAAAVAAGQQWTTATSGHTSAAAAAAAAHQSMGMMYGKYPSQ